MVKRLDMRVLGAATAVVAILLSLMVVNASRADAADAVDPRVVGDGCFVERVDGVAIIHYAPGVGSSVNLQGTAWITTLDVDASSFVHEPPQSRYSIIRRGDGERTIFRCREQAAPAPAPILGIDQGGCLVDRDGFRAATITYAPGIGDSVNLRGDGRWVATLDVNAGEFLVSPFDRQYEIVRRDGNQITTFVCGEVPDPPLPGIGEGGCTVERFYDVDLEEEVAIVRYEPGIGTSLNIRSQGRWLQTLDVDSSEFVDSPPRGSRYSLARRDGTETTFFTCVEPEGPFVDSTCFASEDLQGRVSISWQRTGDGIVVIRRDDRWFTTPDPGTTSITDSTGTSNNRYVIRLRETMGGEFTDIPCR